MDLLSHGPVKRTIVEVAKDLIECPLEFNISYTCTNPFPNCTSSSKLDFQSLWTISQNVYRACTKDWRLFNQTPYLTLAACKQIVGPGPFTYYLASDIWTRVTTWKFPLLQLVTLFPRPPLSWSGQTFVLLHLLGYPISTIHSLLIKVASCEDRAQFWVQLFEKKPRVSGLIQGDLYDQTWKSLAIIVSTYDEWGQETGDVVQGFLETYLTSDRASFQQKIDLLDTCKKTANDLAADRTTKFFPLVVAQAFYIGSVAVAFIATRLADEESIRTKHINHPAHNIAFTALYFWIIPAAFLGSVIGSSQTENAIPRILHRFERDIGQNFLQQMQGSLDVNQGEDWPYTASREREGGLYSWQPTNAWNAVLPQSRGQNSWGFPTNRSQSFWRKLQGIVVPVILVALGAFVGMLISFLVPPKGFGCRNCGQLSMIVIWIFSAVFSFFDRSEHRRVAFWLHFAKDLLVTATTLGAKIAFQIGIFNRCSCYTHWGMAGMALPQIPQVHETLQYGIKTVYPALTFSAIAFQLVVFPAMVLLRYPRAIRVFLQRDDGQSNWTLWYDIRDAVLRILESLFGPPRTFLRWIVSTSKQALRLSLWHSRDNCDYQMTSGSVETPDNPTEGPEAQQTVTTGRQDNTPFKERLSGLNRRANTWPVII